MINAYVAMCRDDHTGEEEMALFSLFPSLIQTKMSISQGMYGKTVARIAHVQITEIDPPDEETRKAMEDV